MQATIPSQPNNWLLQYRKRITSQLGEDGIVEKIFEIIPNGDHWCVEFGAFDGENLSNTYHFINNLGWSSVQIEANTQYYEFLDHRYADNQKVTCLNCTVDFEGANTLDQVLGQTPIPEDFDFLSIDIDGNDYHIWESMTVYRPN
jgi:hypothetical protein